MGNLKAHSQIAAPHEEESLFPALSDRSRAASCISPEDLPSAAHSRLSKCASVSLLQVPKVRGKMEDESDMKHTSMLPTNPVPKSVVPLSSTNVAI